MKKDSGLVLVALIRRRKDLDIALKSRWYRIPVRSAPKRRPVYFAFYETLAVGKTGRSINYYARIYNTSLARRLDLLPDEKAHPHSGDLYYKFNLSPLKRLPDRIENKSRRRITFGFTTLKKLLRAREVSRLFDVMPIEEILRKYMERNRIEAFNEYCLIDKGKLKYRLDFAIKCRRGKIAVECDNMKWHGLPRIRKNDGRRDRWLASRGWRVIRFSEKEIVDEPHYCLKNIRKAINSLGGVIDGEGTKAKNAMGLKKTV